MVQFGAFWCISCCNLVFKVFQEILFFYIKNKYFRCTLALGITYEGIFENMLRLMRFGVYIERILKIKWFFSYRNNYSIVTVTPIYMWARGHNYYAIHKKIMKIWFRSFLA